MKLKKIFICIFISFIICGCSTEEIRFSVITDVKFDYGKNNIEPKYLKDNCLVAKKNGKVIAKYYPSYGNLLKIISVENNIITLDYELNLKALQLELARKNNGVMVIQYANEIFEPILIYPKELKSDGACNFVLKDMKKKDKVISFFYDYIDDIGVPHMGNGIIEMNFEKLVTGKYALIDYKYDVNGYFKYDEAGNLHPSKNGDVVIKRSTTKERLLNNFTLNVDNIY